VGVAVVEEGAGQREEKGEVRGAGTELRQTLDDVLE
jgi:hypothetical protein